VASSSPPPAPYLSVIVTAHGRREYILEAVASVLGQKFPREQLEVCAVKDWADPEIDGRLDALGVAHVETTLRPLGAKLAVGIERTRGSVLLFLEDDDAYEPGRLAHVAEEFRADDRLGYYHNGQLRVDASGRPLGAAAYGAGQAYLAAMAELRVPPEALPDRIGTLARIDPDFNLSSIAVRRDVLGPHVAELRAQSSAVDSFVFYAALFARRSLLLEARPLTRYRIHTTNLSLWSAAGEDRLARRVAYQKEFLTCFQPIYERSRREGPPAAERLAAGAYFGSWVLYRVLAREGGRGALARDLVRFWGRSPPGVLTFRRDISAWGLAGVLAPGWARSAFLKRRDREAGRMAGSG
jgi:glycosyltransferase involved in cell wall biosynthesis